MSRKRVASNDILSNQAKKSKNSNNDTYITYKKLNDNLIVSLNNLKEQLFNCNSDNNSYLNIREALIKLNDKSIRIGIECAEYYDPAILLRSLGSPLKRKDALIYYLLKKANETLNDDDKFDFYLAFYSANRDHEFKVKHWFNITGGSIFEESNIDLKEFALIKYTQSNASANGIFYLTMWPKKHEFPIMIKLDILNYIDKLIDEMLIDDILYNTNEKAELIISELIERCPKFINASHIAKIIDCVDFIQNDHLAERFISSASFAYYFKLFNQEITKKSFPFIKKYNSDIVMNILSPKECFKSRLEFIQLFCDDGEHEKAYEILNTYLLPFDQHFSIDLIQKFILFKSNEIHWNYIKQNIVDYCGAGLNDKLVNILDLIKTLHQNGLKELSIDCLNLAIYHQIDNIKSFNNLMDCSNFEFSLNFIKFVAIEAIEHEDLFKKFCNLLIQSDRINRIEAIVKDIEVSYNDYKDNNLIRYLFDLVVQYYESKIASLPKFSWSMPHAIFTLHSAIQQFLQSEEKLTVFGPFSINKARSIANELESNKTEYSVRCDVSGNGKASRIQITKLKDYALIKKNFKEYFEERLNKLHKVLNG